jgi:hypothetical protein
VLPGAILDLTQPGAQVGAVAFRCHVDQRLHAGDRGGRIALQQAFDQAGFAADAARFEADDALGDRFGLGVFAHHVVQAQARFQRRQMARHRVHPALDRGGGGGAADLFHRQACQPQVVQLRVLLQGGIQACAGLVFAAQALPGHQQQLQHVAVVRQRFQQRQQVLQRLQRLAAAQRQFAGQAAHRRRIQALLLQRDLHRFGGSVQVALAHGQLHHQAMQRGDGRVQFQHAAERLLGEGQHVLAQVGEAQCVEHADVVGLGLVGGRQQRQRAIGIIAAQRDHAVDGQQFRVVRFDTRGQGGQALRFIEIVAADRQVGLHQVGGEGVRVQPGGARQCFASAVELAQGQQQAGVLQVQLGIVRGQLQRLLQGLHRVLGLALLLQRKRQPAVGLGLAGFITGPRLGQLHGLVGLVLAQRLDDLVLHGGPVQGQTRIVAACAPVPVQPCSTRCRRCATQRSEKPSPRQFSRKPQWPPQQAVSRCAWRGSCQSLKVAYGITGSSCAIRMSAGTCSVDRRSPAIE